MYTAVCWELPRTTGVKPLHTGTGPIQTTSIPLPTGSAPIKLSLHMSLHVTGVTPMLLSGHWVFCGTDGITDWFSLPCALFMFSRWCGANQTSIHHSPSQPASHVWLVRLLLKNRLLDLYSSHTHIHTGDWSRPGSVFSSWLVLKPELSAAKREEGAEGRVGQGCGWMVPSWVRCRGGAPCVSYRGQKVNLIKELADLGLNRNDWNVQ